MNTTNFSGRLFMVISLVFTYCFLAVVLAFTSGISNETKLAIFAAVGLLVQTICKDYFNRSDRPETENTIRTTTDKTTDSTRNPEE